MPLSKAPALTVWESLSLLVHCTEPPAAIVTDPGENVRPAISRG
jgi:hypothetical protein